MSESYLSLNYAEIKDKFPLSLREVQEWIMKNTNMREGMKSMGVDMDSEAAIDRTMEAIIQFSPRALYDAFDGLGCRIYITDHQRSTLEPGGPPFYYYNSMNRASKVANSRKDAELGAFVGAFEILEKTLVDGKNQAGIQTSDRGV